jgi:hypothetical protein
VAQIVIGVQIQREVEGHTLAQRRQLLLFTPAYGQYFGDEA